MAVIMFGYVIVNKDELKIKDFNKYRSFYCGLCQQLRKKYGLTGQLSLSYDMTFLILLLTGLYEEETITDSCKCIAHPFEKHPTSMNSFTDYGADMNLLLTWYKCEDDWADEKKYTRHAYGNLLKKKVRLLKEKYPEKAVLLQENFDAIHAYESSGQNEIDVIAGYFGKIMAGLFVYKEDEWAETLGTMGFFLGKFIYLLDAYEDLEKDFEKGNYNPFLDSKDSPDLSPMVQQILTMMMAECCKAFERLPILNHIDLLRNILYSGVWSRYEAVTLNRKKDKNNAKSL